jgi:asparagine synthase (glutamine-hydrolysing)
MKRHSAQIQTFSVGYRGKAAGFNELSYAKIVSDHIGTQHHELILEAQSSIALLPRILWHFDEPHGEPTSALVYLLCEFTRRFVKVAVGGTGGDEIFYGYPRHLGIQMLEYYRRMPRVLRKSLIERIISKWPESTTGNRFAKRAKRFISGCDLPPAEAYLTWVRLIHPDIHSRLFSERVRETAIHPAGDAFLIKKLAGNGRSALLDKVAALDIEGYLPEYQLAYMDRMSMAHGLEVRSPYCDYDLVKYVTSLPHDYRLKGLRSKHILKEVAKEWIPSSIAERKKVGFDSPIGQWFKGELREFLQVFLSKAHLKKSGLLDPDSVQALIADHLSGRRDYSLQLWSIIALEGWYRMYIEDGLENGADYRLADMRGAFHASAGNSAGRFAEFAP